MQSNLIRPSQVDSAGRGVMVDSSERGLCSGEGIETTEFVDGNEVRQPRVPVRPYSPTQADLKEHYPLHLHYRSWCPDCVHGKGHSKHHRSSNSEPSGEVTWHMDYCFYSKKTLEEHDHDAVVPEGS